MSRMIDSESADSADLSAGDDNSGSRNRVSRRNGSGALKIDMLSGGLWGKIIIFALPLIASGVLQQSFSSVDVAVVGRWCGDAALAAVGSNGPLISLILNLFMGISVGANVIISHYIGSGDEKGIARSVETTLMVAIVTGVAVALLGVFISPLLLVWISTPEEVLAPATLYLRIFFCGVPFLMLYNFGSAVLRSMGDTRRPFYVLAVSGVINVGLNLLTVIVFDMNVAGVGIATVVSEAVSGIWILDMIRREKAPFGVKLRKMRVYGRELNRMLRIGLPAGLQGMVFALSNTLITGNINLFGAEASAGSGAALTYEYYCYFVIVAFVQAAVAFTGANYGAGKIDRCKKVFKVCMTMSVLGCMLLNLLIVWQKEFAIGIFTQSPEVMAFAYMRLTGVLMLQWMASSYEISGACMRGLGYSMTPTVLTILGTCVLRVVWVTTVTANATDFNLLMLVYPVTWVITGTSVLVAYVIVTRRAYRKIHLVS